MSEFEWQEDNAKPHTAVREELRKSLARGRPKGQPKTKEELLQACVDAWNNDLRAEHLELAFRLLHVVRRQIIEKKGGNNFAIKHTGLRKQMKAEGFKLSD